MASIELFGTVDSATPPAAPPAPAPAPVAAPPTPTKTSLIPEENPKPPPARNASGGFNPTRAVGGKSSVIFG